MSQNKGFKRFLKSIFGKEDELELETQDLYLNKLDTIPENLRGADYMGRKRQDCRHWRETS